MGAIYGLIGEGDRQALGSMGERLAHRGVATNEVEFRRGVLLGERVHGTSLRVLATEDVVLVADADLYNAAELRDELSRLGHTFHSNRDDEVFLAGYLQYGPAICERLNGDYALALWDGRENLLVLARDPMGTRPLHYWRGEGLFAFASEYKALLALPMVPARPDRQAIQELQYTKFPPLNGTLLAGIASAPAGHVTVWKHGELRSERYWSVEIEPVALPEGQLVRQVREHFLEAVRRRVADIDPVGATLSGGIDSAAVAAAIRRVKPEATLHTFTCGYGPDDPEVRGAEITAEALSTSHHPIFMDPADLPRVAPRVVWHLEDPIARSESVLKFVTAGHAARHVSVVMAGYSGDGLYAGMDRHKLISLIQRLPWLRTPVEEFYQYTQTSAPPESLAGRLLQRAYYRGADAPPPRVIGAEPPARPRQLPASNHELVNRVLKAGLESGVPKWMPKVDRTHMAHGVRVRSPYFDIELIRHAFTIPDRCKIKGWREKHILREALRPLLPEAVLNRPKFAQAVSYDRRLSDVLERLASDLLSPRAVRERGLFQPGDLEMLRRRPRGGVYSPERAMRLWTAIMTEIWARTFLDLRGEQPAEPGEAEPELALRAA